MAVGLRVTRIRRLSNGKVLRHTTRYTGWLSYYFAKLIAFPFKALWWCVKLPFRIIGFLFKSIFRRK